MRLKHRNIIISVLNVLLLTCTYACNSTKSEQTSKPKYLWICAEANFARFADRDTIDYYLNKALETGFDHIVVDVKPIQGEVLYKSNICPSLTIVDSVAIERDWDYLSYFIEKGHQLGLKVVASACVFPAGSPYWHRGLVYDDTTYCKRTCLERLPDGTMKQICDDDSKVAAFLNPAREDNRQFAMAIISELIHNYEIDGLALDYCRFPDAQSDFSNESQELFEKYLGEPVENFPDDIYHYDNNGEPVPGKYYKQWWAWRAGIISDFVHQVSDTLHAVRPDAQLNYWAASWIHALKGNGQNWASPRSQWSQELPHGSSEYNATGFAPYLDNFIVGTYLDRVYGPDDNESIEYGLARADTLIKGDCHVIGSIYARNHNADPENKNGIKPAVSVCLSNSEGLMVFDIIQVIEMNLWDGIKQAIDEYEAQ